MFALHAASRAVLAATAFAAFGGAFVTTPIVARGDARGVVEPSPTVATLRRPIPIPDVTPRRDPFAGGDAIQPRSSAASPRALVTMPALAPVPEIPAALRALPANAGAGDNPFTPATGARTNAVVTAVVTGAHPVALVDDRGTTRILTVGDLVDGDAIVAIDAAGVRLSNGHVLPLVHRVTEGR